MLRSISSAASGDEPPNLPKHGQVSRAHSPAMPYSRAVFRRLICAAVAVAPVRGHADGIAIVGGSPRAIGRAGAATVGDDGGGALLINPAAMARRDTTRAELGAAVIDDSVHWQSDTDGAALSVGRAGSRIAPLGAAIGAIGDWVLGLGAMTAAVAERSLPRPGDLRADDTAAYDYRYTGIAGSYRRDTVAIGTARRFGDSLALGVSFGASRVSVAERRRLWVGTGSLLALGSPANDVDLSFTASSSFSPSAVAGVLYAPVDTRIEIGASVGWTRSVALDGTVTGTGTPMGPTVMATAPHATLEVRQPVVVRAGGRYVGDRVVAELDGDLWIAASGSDSTAWEVRGVSVAEPSRPPVDLLRVPSRIAQHTHVALRSALDLELIPGFLWATGGYAYSSRATPASRMSPTFGDLGGHTLGLGLEATSGGVTVTLGWSRTWSPTTRAPTELWHNNPLGSPDGPVPGGNYSGSLDQVGVLVETELGER
jgi:hypothetical protein